jgi:hypothetical protein
MQPSQPSIWKMKPWWCQPWSIVLTGCLLVGGSWVAFQKVWLTVLIGLPISAWMGFFLILYPRLMQREELTEK